MDKTVKAALYKAKYYMICTWVFLIGGFLVFALLYTKNVEGRFMEAMGEPHLIIIFLIPFLPAAFLSLKTKKCYKHYEELVKKDSSSSNGKS